MRLHLVDGTFELFRAHYSKRPERPFKATSGLLSSLLALLANPAEQVTHLAIAFDNPIRSFRNDLFAGYKGSPEKGVAKAFREFRARSRFKFQRHLDIGWWGRSYIAFIGEDGSADGL